MFDPGSYTIATWILLPRLLGFIYFCAFGAFLFQIKGLIGKNGIMPIGPFLKWVKERRPKSYFTLIPSVFWLNYSDNALMAVVGAGTALSVLLMFGVYPPLLLFLLYVLYISIVSTGQDFLSFGWEGFLLEITFNAFFLTLMTPANVLIWISINLVMFRFHFQGGVVKLQSKDPNWRNLTGVAFHYLSQPLPNTQAWYAYKLPMWFQKFSTLLMLFSEIVVPFGIFGPDDVRFGVFVAFVGLQLAIWFTGNFSYLNHMTIVLCIILVSNHYLEGFISPPTIDTSPSLFLNILCSCVGAALILFHGAQLWNSFKPSYWLQRILLWLAPYHISNRYGIFAVMTTKRHEVIFEGSDDGINWKEYLFFYKPSEPERRPRRISPYQPRIDWQAWFLPLGHYQFEEWFTNFQVHLLKGTPEVLALVRENPFKEKPPLYVRTIVYDYTYTTFEERKKTGRWWNREYKGVFTSPIMLRH